MVHNVEDMTVEKAYDIVRREFYALRHAEDVERRIAKEEAMKVGAYFGMSVLDVGMQLEDQQYEYWKKWAGKMIQSVRAEQDAAYTNFGATEEADPDNSGEVDSAEADSGEAPPEDLAAEAERAAATDATPKS